MKISKKAITIQSVCEMNVRDEICSVIFLKSALKITWKSFIEFGTIFMTRNWFDDFIRSFGKNYSKSSRNWTALLMAGEVCSKNRKLAWLVQPCRVELGPDGFSLSAIQEMNPPSVFLWVARLRWKNGRIWLEFVESNESATTEEPFIHWWRFMEFRERLIFFDKQIWWFASNDVPCLVKGVESP